MARIATIATAFNAGFLVYSGVVLTETLFVFFFLLFFIFLMLGILSRPLLISFLLAGVFIGIASLIRTGVGNASMLCGLIVGLLFISGKFAKRISCSLMLGLGWICVVLWWLVRNYMLTGYLVFSTLSGPHFINHAATRLTMNIHNVSYEQAKQLVYKEVAAAGEIQEYLSGRTLNEVEAVYVMERVAKKIMLKDPMVTVKLFFINIIKTCCSLYSSELLFVDSGGQLPQYVVHEDFAKLAFKFLRPKVRNSWIRLVVYFEIIFLFLMLFGVVVFLWQALFDGQKFKLVSLIFLYIFIFIGASLVCGYARLRLPIEPFCIILAVKYWIDVVRRRASGE